MCCIFNSPPKDIDSHKRKTKNLSNCLKKESGTESRPDFLEDAGQWVWSYINRRSFSYRYFFRLFFIGNDALTAQGYSNGPYEETRVDPTDHTQMDPSRLFTIS